MSTACQKVVSLDTLHQHSWHVSGFNLRAYMHQLINTKAKSRVGGLWIKKVPICIIIKNIYLTYRKLLSLS